MAFEVGQVLPLQAGAASGCCWRSAGRGGRAGAGRRSARLHAGDARRAQAAAPAGEHAHARLRHLAGEFIPGAFAIAAPVFHGDSAVAGLALAGPANRCTPPWQLTARPLSSRPALALSSLARLPISVSRIARTAGYRIMGLLCIVASTEVEGELHEHSTTSRPASCARLVDTDRYPIDDLDSEAGRELIARCRADLAATGACQLDGFLRPTRDRPARRGGAGAERPRFPERGRPQRLLRGRRPVAARGRSAADDAARVAVNRRLRHDPGRRRHPRAVRVGHTADVRRRRAGQAALLPQRRPAGRPEPRVLQAGR